MTAIRALQSHEAAPAATQSGEPIAWMADAAQPTLNRHELVDGGFTEAEIIPLYTAPPAPAGADWRTIDSAPKDGRYILAGRFRDTELKWVKHSRWMTAEEAAEEEDSGVPDDYCAGWTDGEDEYDYCYPTHWMPLPAAPKPEGD